MSNNCSYDSDTKLALPLEIINQGKLLVCLRYYGPKDIHPFEVFLQACIDKSAVLPLLAVCKTIHSWLLPVLYHSITFTRSSQLSKFLSSHDIPSDPMESHFSLIQSIYIGNTPKDRGDLLPGSTNWPVTIVSRILWLSTSLKRLTLLNLDQNKWQLFEHTIPSSLECLSLGPVHGPFHPQDLTRKPQLKWFTSAVTYMRDDEVCDAACYPSMRVFRRLFYPVGITPHYAVDQIGCIDKTKTLERLEIVVCGDLATIRAKMVARLKIKVEKATRDKRVLVKEDSRESFIHLYWEEWEEYRVEFIGEFLP